MALTRAPPRSVTPFTTSPVSSATRFSVRQLPSLRRLHRRYSVRSSTPSACRASRLDSHAACDTHAAARGCATCQRRCRAACRARARTGQRVSATAGPARRIAVIGIAVGFAAGLIGEMRRPRVADVAEAERATGFASSRTSGPTSRRRSARADAPTASCRHCSNLAPTAIAFSICSSRGMMPGSWIITVAGRDSSLAAVVAANVAALAALDARASLLIDADPAGCAAGDARGPGPGLGDIARGELAWTKRRSRRSLDATVRLTSCRPADGQRLQRSRLRSRARSRASRAVMTRWSSRVASRRCTTRRCWRCHASSSSSAPERPSSPKSHETWTPSARTERSCGVVLWDREEPHVPTREELDALASAVNRGVARRDADRDACGLTRSSRAERPPVSAPALGRGEHRGELSC